MPSGVSPFGVRAEKCLKISALRQQPLLQLGAVRLGRVGECARRGAAHRRDVVVEVVDPATPSAAHSYGLYIYGPGNESPLQPMPSHRCLAAPAVSVTQSPGTSHSAGPAFFFGAPPAVRRGLCGLRQGTTECGIYFWQLFSAHARRRTPRGEIKIGRVAPEGSGRGVSLGYPFGSAPRPEKFLKIAIEDCGAFGRGTVGHTSLRNDCDLSAL